MKVKYISFVAATVACVIGSGAFASTIDISSTNACSTGAVNLSNAPVIMNTYERPVVLQQAAVCAPPVALAPSACGTTVLQQSAVLAPATAIGVVRPRRHWFDLSALGYGLHMGGPRYRSQSAIVEGTSCQPAVIDACGTRSAIVEQTLSQPALIDNQKLMNSKTLYDYPATIAQPAVVEQPVVQPAVVEQPIAQPAAKTIMLRDTETTVTKVTKKTMRRVYKKCAAKKRVAKKHCARQVRRACDMGS